MNLNPTLRMNALNLLLVTVLIFVTGCWIVTESKQIDNRPPATLTVLGGKATTLNTNDFAQFRKQIMPLIDEMARKKIVSLGEGTHGTSEFYKVRYWITKILVEEKGFNQVAFENDYADSYLLDQALKQGQTDYDALMKQHLIAIWRNQEVKQLLQWMQTHNKTHKRPVSFGGLDVMFTTSDAQVIQQLTTSLKKDRLNQLTTSLLRLAIIRDSIWTNSNRKDFVMADSVSNANIIQTYKLVENIQEMLKDLSLSAEKRRIVDNMIKNIELQFEGPYKWVTAKKSGGNRDSAMAVMATRIVHKPTDKLIIWAHDAHVSRMPVYENSVGGTGGFIERMLPNQYFVLGTGTAYGTFAATDDRFITHASLMKSVKLETPADSLWETKLAAVNTPALFINFREWNGIDTNLASRLVGYDPHSGKGTYDKSHPITEMYDAYLFIRDTQAAQFIP